MSRSETLSRSCSILWSTPRSPGHLNPAEAATGSWTEGGGGEGTLQASGSSAVQ